MTNKAVFLDRDGVLNVDDPDYTFETEAFTIIEGVPEALRKLKDAGYTLIIITNQSGIAKGVYTRKEVLACLQKLQAFCSDAIDGHYYAPYHPDFDSASLTRKPGSLMFEKAIAKFGIDPKRSWMVGDKSRDLVPARKLGVRTVLVGDEEPEAEADAKHANLLEAVERTILAARS